MRIRWIGVGMLVLLLALMAACQSAVISGPQGSDGVRGEGTGMENGDEQGKKAFQPYEAEPPEGWSEAHARFVMSLYEQILAESADDDNVFISPLSIAMALTMTYNGARGETEAAMSEALHLSGFERAEVNQFYRSLMEGIGHGDDGVEAEIANSLWIRQGLPIKPSFVDDAKTWYRADVSELDFDDDGAADQINRWVKAKTRDKIDQIVGAPIEADTIMYLLNAIYFFGQWKDPFDPDLTTEQTFYGIDGEYSHPFMFADGAYRYREDELAQMISLPYGDDRYSMEVLLPKPGRTLDELHDQLTPQDWEEWMTDMTKRKGSVYLPKFRLKYELDLKEVLSALGMGIAFEEQEADFSGMMDAVNRNVFIKKVKHKTYIDVHEEGTEAAAVTSVEAGVTSASPPSERFEMKVDRPFVLAIVDRRTGSFLFLGSIGAPKLP